MCKTATIWCCALALGLTVACGDSEGKRARDAGADADDEGTGKDKPDDEEDSGSDDAPSSNSKGRLRGRVTYADGTALGQVNVRIGDKVLKSDSRGVFTADDLGAGDQDIVIEDGRVSRAQLKVKIKSDRLTQAELSVLPLKQFQVKDVGKDAEISDSTNGAFKIALKAGSLRTKNSKEVIHGEAQARYAVAKESRDLRAAPNLLKGEMGTREVQLESFGVTELRFVQGPSESETELELAQPAEVTLPLGPNTFADKQEVDAWVFDGEQGVWKQEGKATVDKTAGGNGVAKVVATRAAWWSVAKEAVESTCISGTLLAAGAEPLANAIVEGVGLNYWGSFATFTNDDGTFCLSVKPGQNTALRAFGLSGSSYYEWKKEIFAQSQAAQCGGSSCTDAGTITGESLFDECTGDVTHDQNHVLLLSSGDPMLDATLKAGLEQHGHTATLGVAFTLFDGKLDLSPYDAIYLQANYNWSSGDMPVAGQRQLINWVNCGGGLVTTEWTTWKIGSGGFQLIDAIFPAARTTAYGYPTSATYSKVTADDTLNRGLPDSFTFMTTSYGGTESNLNPRPGAVIYYDSMMLDAGLLGWPYNLGRVASFSTTVGANQVADATFVRLIANTIDWAQKD